MSQRHNKSAFLEKYLGAFKNLFVFEQMIHHFNKEEKEEEMNNKDTKSEWELANHNMKVALESLGGKAAKVIETANRVMGQTNNNNNKEDKGMY